MTANFKFNGDAELNELRSLQPNKPLHVTEFWPGWFDHWFEPFHNILSLDGMKIIILYRVKMTLLKGILLLKPSYT